MEAALSSALASVLEPALLIAIGTVFMASIVRGFTGFGAAIVQAPVFALLYTAPEAVATMVALGTLASAQLLPGAAREANWRQIAPIIVLSWVTIPLGSLVLLTLDPDVMRRTIAALVLVMVVLLASGWRYPFAPGPVSAGAVGAVSGFTNGATGVGGPPVILYMLAGHTRAGTIRGSMISFYTFLNGGTCVALIFNGVFTLEIVLRALVLWPVQIGSLVLGAWLFRRANDAVYRRIALALMLGVALLGLFYPR